MSKLILLASALVLGTTLWATPQAEARGGGYHAGGGVHAGGGFRVSGGGFRVGGGGFRVGVVGHPGFGGYRAGYGVRVYRGYAGGYGWRGPGWGYYGVPACYPFCGYVVVR